MRAASEPLVLKGIVSVLEAVHQYNLVPYGTLTAGAASLVCKLFDGAICGALLKIFGGGDPKIDYTERSDVYMSYLPSGAGYKDFVHYGQLIHAEKEAFRRFDHGKAGNL